MERGQAADEIRADLDARHLAQLLRAGLAEALSQGLGERGKSGQGGLETSLRRSGDLLLDGFRKRNERVRGPVGGRGSGSSPAGAT